MTPAERRQLESAYERLYKIYDEGDLRPAELDEMYRIYDQLGPIWEAEAEKERVETQPTLQAREPSVVESFGDWLSKELYQDVLGFSPRSSYGEGQKMSNLLSFIPGPGTIMSGAQVPRDIRSGDYGMAALNAAIVPLDLLSVGPIRRGLLEVADAPLSRLQQGQIPDYAYLTHEAQPYSAVGRNVLEGDVGVDARPFLPGATRMTESERVAFFEDPRRSWVDPETGGDVLSQEIGARTLPTLRGQGIYQGPDGLETNPVAIGRSYATPAQLQATESLRGLLDVQGATPWVRLRQGELPAIYFKRDEPADLATIERMRETGSEYGLPDVVDVGEGYIVTDFGGAGKVTRTARKALEEASGLKGIRSRAESGYPGYEGAWEKGAGRAIERYLDNIQTADPDALAALEASSAVQQAARSRAMLAREAGQTLGGSNSVVEEMLRVIGRGEGFGDRLQSYAERLAARRIEPQIPLFSAGTREPLPATHFSSEPRGILDPALASTNPKVRGAEAALPAPYPKQTYFGLNVDQPGGYVKESSLGDVRHEATLPHGLLDVSSGWGDIADEAGRIVSRMEAASGQPLTPKAREDAITAYQMRIAKMRGYGGIYNPQHSLGPIATSFYPVTPRVISGGPQ